MLLRDNPKNREKGILLALSSLPSKYGIGDLGKEAYSFINFLKECGQTHWQILPLNPVGKGNSPYASFSGFAGEILYIDLDNLVAEGLLESQEIDEQVFSKNVDYKNVKKFKIPLLRLAASRFDTQNDNYREFLNKNSYWIEDYALFMAIREGNLGDSFLKLEDGLKYRLPNAIEEFKATHKDQIDFFKITQYFFFCQYYALRRFANQNGIKIIGDLPFYVNLESADVWSHSDIFKLGRDLTPTLVCGVPPDSFSSDGQLWGNPIYDWNYLKNKDFDWWKQRILHNAKMFDILRIDHFRAFADYYCIPSTAKTAKNGYWEKGVGMGFWSKILPLIGSTKIIAEDLGGEDSPLVIELLKETGFPNMKVLQFAFDSNLNDPFLPKNFATNCVCYTGTHDNDTTLGWYKVLSKKEKIMFEQLVPQRHDSPVLNLISYALKSRAELVIIPMQDYLQLDSSHRINIPSTPKGNWEWRLNPKDITPELCQIIKSV